MTKIIEVPRGEALPEFDWINQIGEDASDLAGLGRTLLAISEMADETGLNLQPALYALAYAIENARERIQNLVSGLNISRSEAAA